MRRTLLLFGLMTGLVASTATAVTAPLEVGASATRVPPGGQVVLAANGGDGAGVTWSLPVNGSGATVTAAGVYTAGAVGGVTDTVRAQDGSGNGSNVVITITAALAIVPPTIVPPGGSATLVATGGSGVITGWTLITNNSEGTITSGGVYSAGRVGGSQDVAQVTDSLGQTKTVTITVGPALAITVPSMPISPRGIVQLAITGGSGVADEWTLVTNRSGANLDEDGLFKAGTIGNVDDEVKVTDTLGNVASLTLNIGRGILIRTTSVDVAPRATTVLSPTGGSGVGYRFSFITNNSGGFITSDGVYTAGILPNSRDVVSVVDSLMNTTTLLLNVTAGVSIVSVDQPRTPGYAVVLQAQGGTGTGFAWSGVELPSGGTITLAGLYTPGRLGNATDTVRVVDSVGNTATTSIVVSGGITITAAGSVGPRGSTTLTAAGGSGFDYRWTFVARGSAGKLLNLDGSDPPPGEAAGGASITFRAGPYDSITDTVKVTDSLGNTATLDVLVGPGLSVSPSSVDAQGHNTFTTTPGGSQRFTASGGQGDGFTWTLLTPGSTATLTADGLYTSDATKTEVKDTLLVQDSLGNRTTITVAVLGDLPAKPTAPVAAASGCTSLGGSSLSLFALLGLALLARRRPRLAD